MDVEQFGSVEKAIKVLLVNVWNEQVRGSGTLTLLLDYGQRIGSSEEEQWISYGTFHFGELRRDLCEVKNMTSNIHAYESNMGQFVWDLMAVVDDLAYHAATVMVYCFSIDQAFNASSANSPPVVTLPSDIPNVNEVGREVALIAASWECPRSLSDKERLLGGLLSECHNSLADFDLLVSEDPMLTRAICYARLKRFMRSVLSVQSSWAEVRLGMG